MSERQCPVCKSDMYLNPDIVIYISPCFHKVCESCMYRIFSKGQAPCPECGTMLRKINYITPTFEDIQVERECKIRRTLLRAFRREESEFHGDETRYNEYLETFEALVFELLELKNESLVRDRIRRIQDMGDTLILNPEAARSTKPGEALHGKKKLEPSDDEHKMQRVGLTSDYFDPEELPRIMVRTGKRIHLPDGLFTINEPGGLTHDMVVSLAISSLSTMDTGA